MATTKARITTICFEAKYGSVCWWKTSIKMEQFPREFPPRKCIGWTRAVVQRPSNSSYITYVNANPNHGARRATIPSVTAGKSAGKTLMDPFLRTRSRVARVRQPLSCTMQKPTWVNGTVDGEGARRNGGEKVGGTVLRAKCNESKERQIKHKTDNRAI